MQGSNGMQGTNVSRATAGFERRAYRPDEVKARKTFFSFPLDIPRHWAGGSPVRTHIMNSMHMFLPPFERMIVHVVREILPRLQDPRLREQARGFLGQEAQHARAHALFIENLRAQGYRVDGLQRFGAWLFNDVFERRVRPELCIAIIAAFEHYTDLLVLLVLQGDFTEGCDPRMKELFTWHAAEEVEHNAVAWAMLRALDDAYALRMAGNVLGLTVLLGFLLAGTGLLLHQDGKLADPDTRRELREVFFGKYHLARDIKALFVHYARRDYRPDDVDYGPLARVVLEPR